MRNKKVGDWLQVAVGAVLLAGVVFALQIWVTAGLNALRAAAADGFTSNMRQTTPADALAPVAPNEVLGFPSAFNGATWDRLRTPTVFKVVALGAGTTETTIWTPTTGKRFRLMGYHLTTGAASTLTFKDNTAGTTIFASRGGTDVPQRVELGNGILSGAINRVLTVTRGTSATLDGVVWGTEE
jgi:HAMP domain-containing protein